MAQINAASRHRIRKGEGICLLVWSNVAGVLSGRWRVIYDDGTPDEFILNEFSEGSSRAAVLGTCFPHGAVQNGVVVSQTIQGPSGGASQRGQVFVQSFIATSPAGAGGSQAIVDELSKGYVYTGHSLALDEYVEPGPAGGSGMIQQITTADPAANAEIPDQNVPVGAIWLLRVFTVQLVQGITQTPLPTLELEDASGVQMGVFPITATAIGVSSTAQLTWGIGLTAVAFTGVVGDEFYMAPIPAVYLIAGPSLPDRWATLTDGIGANTNYGSARLVIEEWVMPN